MNEVLNNLTPSERLLIYNMFDEGYATDDWDNSFMTLGVSGRKERGVLASLVKKGIVSVERDGSEKPVYLCEGYHKRELAELVGYLRHKGFKPTPGPWEVCEDGQVDKMVVGGSYDLLVDITHKSGSRNDSDATLISAAPEMYEALSEAVKLYGKPGGPWNVPSDPGSWIEKAKRAVKKARGEK